MSITRRDDLIVSKQSLAREIAAHVPGMSEHMAERLVDIVIGEIVAGLRREGDIRLPSLGRFRIKLQAARRGINPHTREIVHWPAKKVIKFKPTKWFEGKVFDA